MWLFLTWWQTIIFFWKLWNEWSQIVQHYVTISGGVIWSLPCWSRVLGWWGWQTSLLKHTITKLYICHFFYLCTHGHTHTQRPHFVFNSSKFDWIQKVVITKRLDKYIWQRVNKVHNTLLHVLVTRRNSLHPVNCPSPYSLVQLVYAAQTASPQICHTSSKSLYIRYLWRLTKASTPLTGQDEWPLWTEVYWWDCLCRSGNLVFYNP